MTTATNIALFHLSQFPFKSVTSSFDCFAFCMTLEDCFKCVTPGLEGNNSNCGCHIDSILCPGIFTVRLGSAVKIQERIMKVSE